MHRLPQIPPRLRSPLGLFAAAILLLGAFLFPVDAAGATLTIPSAACAGTLQACIDGAPDGGTIEIATPVPFDEPLLIAKSLTLRSAGGVTGRIGNDGGTLPTRTITIRDDKVAVPITVTLEGLSLTNARVDAVLGIFGVTAGGNRIVLRDCDIYFNIDHNNAAAVNLLTNVPATVAVRHNRINSSGQAIGFHSGMKAGSATLIAEGNTISTDSPGFSHIGIQVDAQVGGTVRADVVDNVIRGVAGCYCGAASGILVHANGAVGATVNLLNNTIDAVEQGAPGIAVRRPPAGVGRLTINAFNNVVTRGDGPALRLPDPTSQLVFHNDYNAFFGNREPEYLGGHGLGEHTLRVDPLYVGDGDLRPRPESPLVNAGSPDAPSGLPASDADGQPRVAGGRVDLGAYEHAIPSPAVTAILPPSGTTAGGTPVTIHGSGFFPGAAVTIGAAPVAQVVVVDDGTITAVTPPSSEGTADVVVANPGGLSGALAAGFAYLDDARPIGGLELALVPRQGSASLRLLARLSVAAGRAFDPSADGITLALTPPGGTPVIRAIPAARFVANRRRNRFRFADQSGRTAGGVTRVVVHTAGSGVALEVRANALPLVATGGPGLSLDVSSGANRFTHEATCTPRGRAPKLSCQ